ncbi:ATP-binding protein [Aquisalibacillus elongatus]|uniref:histidine kinase n=1 Tax=Aquisalibacillus elongatus TaxID=485577 RepID=A0A3N5CB08_9BACI|nr:ATP-binding protein [Aquisalibacillus elongatus]RPF55895.1 two-component system sporulation sensor kinase A [Aquisalibacillus elongatus]
MKKHPLVVNDDVQLDLDQDLLNSVFQWFDTNSTNIKLVFDENYKIVYSSYSAETILGYSKDYVVGSSLLSFLLEDDKELLINNVESLGFDRKSLELNFKDQDNQIIYTKSYIGKVDDNIKGKTYYIAVINDISELKIARKMLMNSEKLSSVGQLAASVVHEIRNPLTSIKGFLQLLENDVKDKNEFFNIMKDEVEKIESITSELLYIAKPSELQFKPECIPTLIKEVCLLMKTQARLYDINIDLKSDVKEYVTNCDRSQIKQVFINLIKNAIEAMEREGTIQVHIYQADTLTIDVIDEGEGVPDELKDRLGEPFLTTKEKGTGLGIMVTKQILDNHHASLTVMDNEKQGSIFRVRFY